MILEPLSLDYVIKNEVMVITTKATADQTFDTRVYNADLVESHTAFELMELIVALVAPASWESGMATRSANLTTLQGPTPGVPGMPVTSESNPKQENPGAMPGAGTSGMGRMMPGMGGGGMGGMGGGGFGGMGGGGFGGGMPHGMGAVAVSGEGSGVIRVAKNNTLLIRQTQRVHDEIVELLNQLK